MVGVTGNAPVSTGYQPNALTFELHADGGGDGFRPRDLLVGNEASCYSTTPPKIFGCPAWIQTKPLGFKDRCAISTLLGNGGRVKNRTP